MAEQRYCKRLIEVDLPIKRISEHSRREKSIRHGHISTLHIWWARRPLAACRAVLCAALWPDPADPLCPEEFKKAVARLMKELRDKRGGKPKNWDDPIELRKSLLDFIADFSDWDNSQNQDFLEISRFLVQISNKSFKASANRPLVFDPFAGGGSIPLEAIRIGAEAFASDLNPIPVLINKALLEYIPKYGQQMANEVRKWGAIIKEESKKELTEFYPQDPDGYSPSAYFWARTITCEGPGCGIEVPTMRSLWLAKKSSGSVALKIIPNRKQKKIDFEIIKDAKAKDIGEGTIKKGSVTCPCCGYTTPVVSIRKQFMKRRGGTNDAKLIAVARIKSGQQGKSYRLPNNKDLVAIRKAKEELEKRKNSILIPDEPLPNENALGFRIQLYGMSNWQDIFLYRQLLSLVTLVEKVRKAGVKSFDLSDQEVAKALQLFLAFAIDRQADYLTSLTMWVAGGEFIASTFSRHALPIIWDWAECAPFSDSSGNWDGAINWIALVIEKLSIKYLSTGQVAMCSATNHVLPDDSVECVITDPPYYDAIGYAALSDFFYIWLKRSVGDSYPELFNGKESPKKDECIVDEKSGKDQKYFEISMTKAMSEARRVLAPSGIGVVVFAHKSTAGWEAQLQAMLNAGWIFTASWPIDTERPGRLRSLNSAALASSIHLVCRPRENPDGTIIENYIGDWRDVLQELPGRIHEWMPRLAKEGVVGADAIFACLGPALEIFSKYSHVEKADGKKVELGEYLEQVWAAVAKEALNMIFEGARTEGFEEDSRLTAMWLWTLFAGASENGKKSADENGEIADESEAGGGKAGLSGFSLEFDAARKIAQGLGAHLENLNTLVEIEGDQARLLSVAERVKILFGKDSSTTATHKRKKKNNQMTLFPELEEIKENEWSLGDSKASLGKTILDRLHQAMILFGASRGEALRRFLVEEGVGKDDRFWRLAQALSALYPANTDEKRWVDGVLAKKKSFGF
ncbi:MAG: DUF1156 domain-containing protein [Candidatus Omnitrophota bacterium]